MAAHSVKDLAEEAGLPLQCLNKTFRKEDAHLLAEFCYPWESIAYHLKLTEADISAIKDNKGTAELRRIATLETWSEKFAHKAIYRVLIEAFIQGNRANQALNLCKKIYHEIPAITADHSVSDDRCVDLSPLSTDQKTNDSCDAPSEELVPDRDITESVYQLQMRFICIQNRFLQSGNGTGVTLEQLQTCISTLPSFTSDTPQLLLEATSVNLFTHHLKKYCCALNPDILVGLIEVLGDVETKTMIKEYNRDLRDFECKTKLKDFIGNYNRPTPPDYKEVELKLGDNWGEKTLADVKLINAQISRRSWLVKMVSIGSVYVTFTIPQMEDVELDDHLKDYLQSQCVLQILVRGLCIFNCEAPSSYKSEQEVVIAIKPKNFSSMLQSTAEELLQVFVKDKFEAMETIKGHILSKLNYFSETLLSNSATHSSSEAVELPSFTGTQLKSETMHMDPTTSTSNTGKGQLRKRLSLESAKRSHPMGMKRSRSNFDSVGQPSPKVARSSDNKESSRDDETAERAKQSDIGSEEGATVSIPSEEPSAEEMPIEGEATSNSTVDDIPKLHELELFEQCSLIIRIIDRVSPKWKSVALHLHFEDHRIEIIEIDCHHQSVPACHTMFTRWLEGYGRKPKTWRTLIIALKEAKLCTLAEELEKMFSDSLSTTVSNQTSSSKAPAVVSRKHPLEKSTEEASKKHPRLESSASETSSVNPHLVELVKLNPLMKHRPRLAAFYSHQPEVPEDAWPPVKKIQYINLALIRTEQAVDFNKEFLRQTIRGSVDDIMKDKDDIKYDEVFTEVEEGARLVFEGRPGCGKTTMMNKVSQDWAKWKIFSSSLLILVHLQSFGNQSDIGLVTVLRSTPVKFSDEELQQIQAQIESSQGKGVVFALDGLEEYCPDKKEYKSTFIHKLINGEILPNSVVIVASRPAASQKYQKNATKCIEVLGFLKQQIYQYIDSYFVGDEGKLFGLRTYLEHHPNVMHMCYLPLHMAMVAYLYDIEGASLPETETEIYNHFTLSTLMRSIKKKNRMELDEYFGFSSFEDLSPNDREIFDLILELAFQATVVKPRQVFSADDVQKFFNKQPSNTGNDESFLGLVVVDRCFVKYGLKEIYTFLHLTFQEYLAACHIVQLSSEDQHKLITKYGDDKKLGVVWKFYCGMTQFSDEQKMHNFERLFESTKSDVLLQLHCAHESQQDKLCTHMVKSYNSKILLNAPSLNPADFTALGYVLTRSNVPATELAITSCNIGPEGLSALAKAIGTSSLSLRTISFHRTKIKKMILEFCGVLKQCPQLCTLILSSCGIIKKTLFEMAEMLPTLESLEKLDLSGNDLGVQSVEVLGNVLAKLPNLKSLVWIKRLISLSLFTKTLKGRDIEISLADSENSKSSMKELVRLDDFKLEDVSLISNYFQAHPCTAALIGTLSLGSRGIDDVIAESLAKGILHCTNLQELDLKGDKIGDAGAQALLEGLQHCSNLQKLNLGGNNIGDAGAQTLAEGLQHCTNLQELDLTDNNIGVVGARALIESLHHCTNLRRFVLLKNINGTTGAGDIVEGLPLCTNPQTLKGNNIGDAGAQILAISLQYCTNLKELDLGKNDIGDTGTQAIAQSLQHCTNLLVLIFRENSIGNGGAQTLAEGLQHCTNLQKLDLVDNNIGDAGAQALAESLRHCTNLKELYLWKNNIGVVGAQALAEGLPHCTNPQNLNLRGKNIGDAGAQFLAISLQYYTDVQKLDLQYNNIGVAGAQALAKGLQHCTNLQKLDLCWNNIGDAGAQALAGGLQHYTNLQELNLGENSIGVPGAQALAGGLQHCTNLQKLNLYWNNIGDAGAQALAGGLQHCTNLQELNLEANSIGVPGAQALAGGLQHCTNLQELNLRKNSIGVPGAQALAGGLQHCTNLQKLNLQDNNIGVAGAQALAKGLQHCPNLQELGLWGNTIGDAGAQALAKGLQHYSNLQKLNLWGNNIGDAGAQTLAEGLQHCSNLQTLYLINNSLTDRSVDSLSQLIRRAKQLKELYLYHNKFTDDDLRALRAAAEERKSDFAKLNLGV